MRPCVKAALAGFSGLTANNTRLSDRRLFPKLFMTFFLPIRAALSSAPYSVHATLADLVSPDDPQAPEADVGILELPWRRERAAAYS